jgi:hypothetical protein
MSSPSPTAKPTKASAAIPIPHAAHGSHASHTHGATPGSAASSFPGSFSSAGKRRESLMSESFARQEHVVVNVGDEESVRLISCVKAAQGFDWNQEIFLPSYADAHFDDLERRQDPVLDIVVTDEEVRRMFPQ